MKICILITILLILAIYLTIQRIRCTAKVKEKTSQLTGYNAKTARLSYGNMTYADNDSTGNENSSKGEIILSVHGIFGGYDQAFDTCLDFASDYRILAPSRFGYLESEILGDGTPKEQAAAYAELLDKLQIDKVYLLATSAGGSIAIRFALDYPERTKGLILYCSAMPLAERPEKYAEYAGPPAFFCNDYVMFLMSPLFRPIMGMEPSTIFDMLPVSRRKEGVVLDAAKTNPDMAKNFDDYRIEDLQVPALILHAKDDKLASYADTEKALGRFPNCTFISFETGGHLMTGHGEEIKKAVNEFIAKTR